MDGGVRRAQQAARRAPFADTRSFAAPQRRLRPVAEQVGMLKHSSSRCRLTCARADASDDDFEYLDEAELLARIEHGERQLVGVSQPATPAAVAEMQVCVPLMCA